MAIQILKNSTECKKDDEIVDKYHLEGKKVIDSLAPFIAMKDWICSWMLLLWSQKSTGTTALLLAGGGEMEESLKARAHHLGLQNCVAFFRANSSQPRPSIYAAIDVLAYPRYSMRLTELVTPLKPLEADGHGKNSDR